MIENEIKNILTKSINCNFLNIENESHNHSAKSSQSHFKVVIVSDDFLTMPMLKRHRFINELLADIYKKVHALSIRSYDINQWQKLKDKPTSPICASKKQTLNQQS